MKHVARQELADRQFLVVEDEYLIASEMGIELEAAGAHVVGPIETLEHALDVSARVSFDCAIVDINLRGAEAYPLIDRLLSAGVPVLLVTGYDTADIPLLYQQIPRIQKPVSRGELISASANLDHYARIFGTASQRRLPKRDARIITQG